MSELGSLDPILLMRALEAIQEHEDSLVSQINEETMVLLENAFSAFLAGVSRGVQEERKRKNEEDSPVLTQEEAHRVTTSLGLFALAIGRRYERKAMGEDWVAGVPALCN